MISSEAELREIKKAFQEIDSNSDGILTKEEMMNGLKLIGMNNESEMNSLFAGIDMDENGKIE